VLKDRLPLYPKLETERKTKVITYVTGDRPGLETQISSEALDCFVHHLDIIGPVPRITLYLYTSGGSTLASWSVANLLRQFCDELEIVVAGKGPERRNARLPCGRQSCDDQAGDLGPDRSER
jgi:hypothetical protein